VGTGWWELKIYVNITGMCECRYGYICRYIYVCRYVYVCTFVYVCRYGYVILIN